MLDKLLERAKFNKTMTCDNPELLGLTSEEYYEMVEQASKGEKVKYYPFKYVGEEFYTTVPYSREVMHDKDLVSLTRLYAHYLKSTGLRIKLEGKILNLLEEFNFYHITDELELLREITKYPVIFETAKNIKVAINQKAIVNPYISGGKIITPKIPNLKDYKNCILALAVLHNYTDLLYCQLGEKIKVDKLLRNGVKEDFLKDSDYKKLVALSLTHNISINDYLLAFNITARDYESIHKDLGVIVVPDGKKYKLITEEESKKVSENELMTYLVG